MGLARDAFEHTGARVQNWRRWLTHRRYCPICRSYLAQFDAAGVIPRPDAQCPRCASLERHRLLWLYVRERTEFFDGRRRHMLHVAPERALDAVFARVRGLRRTTVDVVEGAADLRVDLTDMTLPTDAFDVIYCSHVLEHIPDDRRAMAELHRVLAPSGWAILQVPIHGSTTFEDPSVTDPAERLRLFGQADHVRIYGEDYADRLASAGFHVLVDRFVERLSPGRRRYLGLDDGEAVYFCRKGPPAVVRG